MIGTNVIVNMRKIFLNTFEISPENSFPLTKNRQKPNEFNSVMTSVTKFTQRQNPFNLYGFS